MTSSPCLAGVEKSSELKHGQVQCDVFHQSFKPMHVDYYEEGDKIEHIYSV